MLQLPGRHFFMHMDILRSRLTILDSMNVELMITKVNGVDRYVSSVRS